MLSFVSCAYADVGSALDFILGGYAHVPGLRLTRQQACRIWTLDEARCQDMFDALVDAGFLRIGADGAYERAR
jgi:hypothetical protein